MNKIKISTHSPFQPLEAVWLGQGLDESFFDWVEDNDIKKPLQKIINETNEDLSNIRKVCESHYVKVYQDTPLKFDPAIFKNKLALPTPPIQPRDTHLTLDNKIYCTSTEPAWNFVHEIVEPECIVNLFDLTYKDQLYENGNMLSGAYCYRLGKRIIIPTLVDKPMRDFCKSFFTSKGYEVVETNDEGHSDGIMSVVKPGVIVSLEDKEHYRNTFPGWEVFTVTGQSWNAVGGWLKFKQKSKGRWWIPGEESNNYLLQFVNQWLDHWVGYIEETVFDVNMLSLSEEVVLVNNYHKELFSYLEKHKVTPIVCPFRHRYFWDGGIHCVTVDLKRTGEMENYFN